MVPSLCYSEFFQSIFVHVDIVHVAEVTRGTNSGQPGELSCQLTVAHNSVTPRCLICLRRQHNVINEISFFPKHYIASNGDNSAPEHIVNSNNNVCIVQRNKSFSKLSRCDATQR